MALSNPPLLLLIVLLALSIAPNASELLESSSFSAPFTKTDRNGKFTVPNFLMAGDAEVKKTFIRLTPDRQSKRGTLWARSNVGTFSEISATMTFRISGQGSKLFGDGIGLWLTTSPRPSQGSLHGMDPKFEGVAIIIDTFKNVEHGQQVRFRKLLSL